MTAVIAQSANARADTLNPNPNDPGMVTVIRKGVKELDLGGLFVLSYNKLGNGQPTTRVQTIGGAGFQYFINDNLSAGANVLASYDRLNATTATSGFGGTAFATLHARLGLGAFLRPTLGIGALFGKLDQQNAQGQVVRAAQSVLLVRLAAPIAYFASRRVVLQAGPEIDISLGSTRPDDGSEGTSYASVAGGFGVNVGYVF